MKTKNKIRLGIFLIACVAILTFAFQLNKHEVIENTPEISEQEEIYVIPDPCELDTVVCEGEEDKKPTLPVFELNPCEFGMYSETCTFEAYDALTVENMVIGAALNYGIDVDDALAIAECESNFNSRAQNPNSSAKGVYQFLDSTWDNINAGGHQFDAEENILMFMLYYPKYPQWWAECL